MGYEREGKLRVIFPNGEEKTFTSVEKCAGINPDEAVLKDDVDSAMSSTSENPVQNKVISDALADKADLDNGKVPASQLPSYVDDIEEYASLSAFPATGESDKIYVALDTGLTYRWSGSAYVRVNETDLSDYYTKMQTNALLDAKADKSSLLKSLIDAEGENAFKQKTIDASQPNVASGYESVAFNHETKAVQKACASFGGGTRAGDLTANPDTYGFAFACGEMSVAKGRGSFATGNRTYAGGMYAFAQGYRTIASNDWQFVCGAMNVKSHSSEAEPKEYNLTDTSNALFIVGNGYEVDEQNEGSGAESNIRVVGNDAFAIYKDGHAELDAQGSTNKSIVIRESITMDLKKGGGARSIIQVHGSMPNDAAGQSAIALGANTSANADRSIAIGAHTVANSQNMLAMGIYNASHNNALLEIGNGSSSSNRNNAFSVYKDGHAEIDVVTSADKSVTNVIYVQNAFADGYASESNVASGDVIVNDALLNAMQMHLPIIINGARCYFQNDDGTSIKYANMTLNGSMLHVNLIVLDESTDVITFNTFDLIDSTSTMTKSAISGSIAIDWATLKSNTYLVMNQSLAMTADSVDLTLDINSSEVVVKMQKSGSAYSGLTFVEDASKLYEIAIYYANAKLILKCVEVY